MNAYLKGTKEYAPSSKKKLGASTTLKGRYLLRQEAVRHVASALAKANIPGLLIKGYGIAKSAYEQPWQRDMADVDILVSASTWDKAIHQLRDQLGAANVPILPGRPLSRRWLGEQGLKVHVGPATILVEIHNSIDKVAPRPIPFEELYPRALPDEEISGALRIPDREDQLLLTAAHLGNSHFQHERGWNDLINLMNQGFRWRVVLERSKRYRLNTCLYFCLCGLRLRGVVIDPWLVRQIEPSRLRRRLAEKVFALDELESPAPKGLRWIGEQSLLREDSNWLLGVTRYAAIRIMERMGRV